MHILAIETSCDETAIAFVEASGGLKNPRFKILENLIASQIKIHAPYGGVVPNLAKREHIRNLPILFNKIANSSKSKIKSQKSKLDIDLIAVTVGPGLEPALWTGIVFAKEISEKFKVPLVGVNHLKGHLLSFLLSKKKGKTQRIFPAIALIVSGGHTILLLIKSLTSYKKLGETRDDAVGESFDKVARLLSLSYPGGPEIEKIARRGDSLAINFPKPMIGQKNYDFSFSGLKTAVLYYLRDNKNAKKEDVAASFQKAAFDVLIKKTFRAAEEFKAKSIMISGGVTANKELRKRFKEEVKAENKFNLFVPDFIFSTDNAAMMALAGYLNYLKNDKLKLEADGNLSL